MEPRVKAALELGYWRDELLYVLRERARCRG